MEINNSKAAELWNSQWSPETHTTEYAAKRIKSAQSSKLTPVKIDKTDYYGYFQGSHGRYETFLDYCPCGDFLRSKLPCKHIYRLAIELGLMDIHVDNNIHSIPTPKNERLDLDKMIDIVEELSIDAQKELLCITSNVSSTNPLCLVKQSEIITELLNSEIVYDSEPENHLIDFGTKKDISELLDNENIKYNSSATKKILMEICSDCIPQKAMARFGEVFYVGISGIFSAHKIHIYLHRKYDTDFFYVDDKDMTLYEVPLIDTELPNDDITEQLIKRGYYSR